MGPVSLPSSGSNPANELFDRVRYRPKASSRTAKMSFQWISALHRRVQIAHFPHALLFPGLRGVCHSCRNRRRHRKGSPLSARGRQAPPGGNPSPPSLGTSASPTSNPPVQSLHLQHNMPPCATQLSGRSHSPAKGVATQPRHRHSLELRSPPATVAHLKSRPIPPSACAKAPSGVQCFLATALSPFAEGGASETSRGKPRASEGGQSETSPGLLGHAS